MPTKEYLTLTTTKSKVHRSLAPSLLPIAFWYPLHLPRPELSLPLNLPTGQTFRWYRTSTAEYTGVVSPNPISLKHLDESNTIAFFLHGSSASDAARTTLVDYLNLDISLAEMWHEFTEADPQFAEVVLGFDGGARVLRQDPIECLFQFLCLSNNNIGRIERMVGVLSSFGEYLGMIGGFDFHKFLSLNRLADVSGQQLRKAGFRYRFVLALYSV